jgi:hypothetical protein
MPKESTLVTGAMLVILTLIGSSIASPACANLVSNLVYHLTICGDGTHNGPQPGSPCYVQPAQVPPPPEMMPIVREAINKSYPELLPGHEWYIGIGGSNKQGYVYGRLYGATLLYSDWDTQFIFYQGQILCCHIDMPYWLGGLNDSGVFIGDDGNGFPFASSEIDSFWVVPYLPNIDASSSKALKVLFPPDFSEWNYFLAASYFVAIDNNNRISGVGPLGAFLLTPVPEPSTGTVIAAALAIFLLLCRRLA